MKLNRKGYLTIEIILGAVIAFGIAFFLIEITTKLVSVSEDNYKDTIVSTDSALIISEVKELIEKENSRITNISCSNNTCTISSSNGQYSLKVDNNKLSYSKDNTLYERNIDSSLSDITLTSSVNGNTTNKDNIYFKISGKNIYSGKDYDIIIPISAEIGPVGTAPAISCSTVNVWTNERGKGQVDVTITDNENDLDEIYYYNYSLAKGSDGKYTTNDWDTEKQIITSNSNRYSISNAKTNMIKVVATDKGGNKTEKECTTNVDTLKPYAPFAQLYQDPATNNYFYKSGGNTYSVTVEKNTCCINRAAEPYCNETYNYVNIRYDSTEYQECTVKCTGSRPGYECYKWYVFDNNGDKYRDGKSDWKIMVYRYYNNAGTNVYSEYEKDTGDDWVRYTTEGSSSARYDYMTTQGGDVAGNFGPELRVYKE